MEEKEDYSIEYHVYNICEFLTLGHDDFAYSEKQSKLISHITFPHAIESLDYNIRKFSGTLGWCHNADKFLFDQEYYESQYILNMMRLNFTILSLEAVVYHFFGSNQKCKSCVLNIFLNEEIDITFIDSFKCTLIEILDRFETEDYFSSKFNLEYLKTQKIEYKLALDFIYKLRNKFMHGEIAIPMHIEDDSQKENEIKILQLSQKVTLFIIQILFYIGYKDKYDFVQFSGEEFPLELAIKNLHKDITKWPE